MSSAHPERKMMRHKIHRFQLAWALLLIAFCLSCGCTAGARSKMMVNSMKPLLEHMNTAARKNNDIKLVRDAMPAALVQMDGLVEASPDNKYLLATAAENYYAYSFFFVESTDKKAAEKLYLKARNYAFRALNQNKAFKEAASGSLDDFSNALQTFEKEDVPAMYWAVSSWLAWMRISHSSGFDSVIDFPKIEAMMDRMLVLDETFNYGAVHILIGAYYASIPDTYGGIAEGADYHFEQAFDISDSKYLLWHVFYAQFYAFQVQDKQLYLDSLETVISAPDDLFPKEAFSNQMAKKMATQMREETDLLFLD